MTGPLAALMNGVSYMIPFVVVGGLLIALSLGIAGKQINGKLQIPDHTFWSAVNDIGVVGFELMIPILGGFIASTIAGRAAVAPAMVLSFLIGNQDGQLFNWSRFEFENFVINGSGHPANAGFFGSIAVGFAVGYGVKLWLDTISLKIPKQLKPIEPILVIPILFTFVGWLFFAYFGYVPLYYISEGLNIGITSLVDDNLFFIAGIVLGAMVGFDMGGPINKIAFLLGSAFIEQGKPEVMGAVAAAIDIPPLGYGLGVLIGKYVFRSKVFDKEDVSTSYTSIIMSFVGITEGAIPFAIKYPKSVIISNMVGSAIDAGLVALFQITDSAAHGGPIVWILGAIGKDGVRNYLWGLFYLVAIIAGALTTATLMIILESIYNKKKKKDHRDIKKTETIK
ncbi:MAG: PTS fructose transporter subunit IIC [Mycoplasma sp.]|nr:PTS fructose transporter subunit IIC [Mycoplasma sp.]